MRHTRQFLALLAASVLAVAVAAAPAQAAKPGPAPAPMRITITSTTFDGPRMIGDMNGCWLTIRATLSTPVPSGRYSVEYSSTVEYPPKHYFQFTHWESVTAGQTQLVSNPAMMGFCGTDGAKVTAVGVRLFNGRTLVAQATKPIDPPYACVVPTSG